jgi:hypothetical protein
MRIQFSKHPWSSVHDQNQRNENLSIWPVHPLTSKRVDIGAKIESHNEKILETSSDLIELEWHRQSPG